MYKTIAAAALATAALIGGSAQAATLYSNDFTTDTSGFVLADGAVHEDSLAAGVDRYIGGLTRGASASLTLDTTGLTTATVYFDLYTILSLDGSNPGTGPDVFKLEVVGGSTLLNETFSNFLFQNQTYGPDPLNIGGTGSDNALYGRLGYHWLGYGEDGRDRTYHLAYTFATTGNSTTLLFTSLSGQANDDEHYGIDNVRVTGGVPEPGAWALMILGFGAAGSALRRRRALTA
ncbi:PEPxxWA-CTERM sorting domain-containing protein [Phenylobacterium sp.]|uniref:PEPxxWA-CTERM sorting domain-containing protein n=1 Tax=Phenylobacterium sp. TaxID=1871053 RepID=UPI0025CD8DB0|nr:PEPxxWA-CTERM sorting domain-containing protein [Phenylobacterium sp.]MBX3485889.1 PEP-CTERM sorting domain-containing protein [Phenylobacterium sp.]MCW5759900.1 PEP-CTERM sorting domain-containing protein [Phenylobacterium sp.]